MDLKFNIIEGKAPTSKRKNDIQDSGMDMVHNPDARHWIGPKFKLREYFDEFKTLVVDSREKVYVKSSIKEVNDGRKMKSLVEGNKKDVIPKDLFQQIATNCDAENFT